MTCRTFEESIELYLYDELPAEDRATVEEHLAACVACQEKLASTRKLHELMSQRAVREPGPEVLVRCRGALEEALDREQHGWRSL